MESDSYIIIEAGKQHKKYFRDLVRSRELLYFFALRDVLVCYRQAVLGLAWVLGRPLMSMAVFYFIFGKVANLASGNASYPLFILVGILPWQFFAGTVTETCTSLVNNRHLISRVYFPRAIIPCANVASLLVDFGFMSILITLMTGVISGFHFSFLFFPFLLGLCLILNVAIGLWLSSLTALYRDFRILIPFLIQFGMLASPVGYGTFIIPEKWQWLYSLNPMVGIIEGFRWVFLGQVYPYLWGTVINSVVISLLLLVSGYMYFRSVEDTFVDRI